MKLKILNLEPVEYSQEARLILEERFGLVEQEMSRDVLLGQVHKYDILIVRLGHQIDKEVLNAAINLKVIVTATTGLNHIDLAEAEYKGIEVLSLKGEVDFLNTVCATAEHTMGLMLALLRCLPRAFEDVRTGKWDRNKFKGYELKGKTLGILGYGRLGKKVAGYAVAFGMKVIAYDQVEISDSCVEPVPLNTLFEDSDVISIHLSYSQDTHHFVDKSLIEKMKRGVFVINTSRGEVVDECALLQSLLEGQIAGAAIDVMQGEYGGDSLWVQNDPLINYARVHNNLIITPHIGGATYESMANTEIFMAHKLISYCNEKFT